MELIWRPETHHHFLWHVVTPVPRLVGNGHIVTMQLCIMIGFDTVQATACWSCRYSLGANQSWIKAWMGDQCYNGVPGQWQWLWYRTQLDIPCFFEYQLSLIQAFSPLQIQCTPCTVCIFGKISELCCFFFSSTSHIPDLDIVCTVVPLLLNRGHHSEKQKKKKLCHCNPEHSLSVLCISFRPGLKDRYLDLFPFILTFKTDSKLSIHFWGLLHHDIKLYNHTPNTLRQTWDTNVHWFVSIERESI